jgi:hypothetical protein
MAWFWAHLPFVFGFVLASAALSRLVVAYDCIDTNPDDLTEAYLAKANQEVSDGLRWFYCGGLAASIASLGMMTKLFFIIARAFTENI